jgi:hypothetical protein
LSSYLNRAVPQVNALASSTELSAAIASTNFRDCTATVIGYGNMGRQFVKALRALGVQNIRVCSRSRGALEELQSIPGVETIAGGFEGLRCQPKENELAIVATPTALLINAAERLASLGFRKLLIEKPVSLWSADIARLNERLKQLGVVATCAYNRVAYPSFLEAQGRASNEGGVKSCTYTFTEMIRPEWTEFFPAEELSRWGVANSLHVIGMAHQLIGLPTTWHGYASGTLPWHTSGAIFVGSGISDRGIPFAYHADWGSTGRWSLEVHTSVSSYRLCPLERLFRKTSATGEWEEVELVTFAPDIKVGLVEQVAAMLSQDIQQLVQLISLPGAVGLTRYAEQVFGYTETREQ